MTVKKIKLSADENEVDCRVEGQSIVLKTMYLKKVG